MVVSTHLQRLSAYAALLGEALGEDADILRVASRLHDVGMAGTADTALTKPGPLTRDERREMQEHAELGHAMLKGSGIDVLDAAAEIALTHHERWDGTGYPRRLEGEDIPLAGRILAVADAFDAMTTDRVYRPAGTVEEAVDALRAERNRQFDARVVDAFLDRLDQVRAILAEFPAPAEAPDPARDGDGAPMTLQAAAATLAISPSRLRRWADEGRISAVRTAGGHRRFPLEAVRRLATERGVRPNVRPVEPPEEPLPVLAQQLRGYGAQMVSAASTAVYREGPQGWFASELAHEDLREWLGTLQTAAERGDYAPALQASDALMKRAHSHAASLLERHAFLERFGQVAVRALVRAGAARTEIAYTRRLFTALQQGLLEKRG
ncbi:excisionase family DNA binding protein [Solirubrobacter pauli]|uniref:Excisionase family DNA binding protein n=1 Tax=Solirubrobacter pauli TaxID=166793 RepID=A0A660L4N1_9ACTN|nr:HD domain-containing phosphohydrolase [Solirubrobacter pauli]RKQ88164.1 excisionase family DNA binding protein [Solirubrobacter pauli]